MHWAAALAEAVSETATAMVATTSVFRQGRVRVRARRSFVTIFISVIARLLLHVRPSAVCPRSFPRARARCAGHVPAKLRTRTPPRIFFSEKACEFGWRSDVAVRCASRLGASQPVIPVWRPDGVRESGLHRRSAPEAIQFGIGMAGNGRARGGALRTYSNTGRVMARRALSRQ